MGVVAMEVVDCFLSRGYPHITQAVYVYCDTCGSFWVKKIVSFRQWIFCAGGILVTAVITFPGMPWIPGLMAAIFYGQTAFVFWGLPRYRCKTCSHLTTIKYNTRNYPSNNSVIDVPDNQIEKFYFDYWPDEGELEEHLKPPETKS